MLRKNQSNILIQIKIFGLILSSVFLAACTTSQQIVEKTDPASALIERYAQSASVSLRLLSDVEHRHLTAAHGQQTSKSTIDLDKDLHDLGLSKKMTLSWTDDIEYLVERMCREAGWSKLESLGRRVSPVLVSINASGASIIDILRDAGGQSGASAEIVLSPSNKTMLIKYPQIVQPSQLWERR